MDPHVPTFGLTVASRVEIVPIAGPPLMSPVSVVLPIDPQSFSSAPVVPFQQARSLFTDEAGPITLPVPTLGAVATGLPDPSNASRAPARLAADGSGPIFSPGRPTSTRPVKSFSLSQNSRIVATT